MGRRFYPGQARDYKIDQKEVTLILAAQGGDKRAMRKVVQDYEPLVAHVVKKYEGLMEQEDLQQEGYIGLMKAVEKFDPAKGRFSNHAAWWIRAAVGRSSKSKANTIRLPTHIGEQLVTLNLARSRIMATTGLVPTVQELADQLGWTVAKIEKLDGMVRQPFSLDNGPTEDTNWYDLLPGDDELFFEDDDETRDWIREIMGILPALEADIISMRFCLSGEREKATFKQIAKKHGMSEEAARQISHRALHMAEVFMKQTTD